MQKRALCLVLMLMISLSMSTIALAAESDVNLMIDEVALETSTTIEVEEVATEEVEEVEVEEIAEEPAEESTGLLIDGAFVAIPDTTIVENGITYISYVSVVRAIYPDATIAWESDCAAVRADDFEMFIYPAGNYIQVGDRYLWVEDGIKIADGIILVPIRTLAEALGASITWDGITNTTSITSGENPLASGAEVYSEDVIYWLSRIINAESGNQTLSGKIAVGNVVLNRVDNSLFPSTVYDVIFQKNQFSPTSNGTIYNTPNAQSIIAAKLCLEGATTAENCLYFVNPVISANSWAARNRTYVQTIGEHAFFA